MTVIFALFGVHIKDFPLFGGRYAEYFNTSSFFNAAATMAEILNVFLLLALPVDALKFPSVPMVEPFTQRISGGTS